MNHIFICTTSYHLLVCHAAARLLKKSDPNGKYSLLITYNALRANHICNIDFWCQIINLDLKDIKPWSINTKKTMLQKIKEVKNKEEPQVYICNDSAWRVQIIATLLTSTGGTKKIIEDGMAAYREGKKKSKTQWIYQNVYLKFRYGPLLFNYDGVNKSSAEIYFSVRDGAFPWVNDRNKIIKINQEFKEEITRVAKLTSEAPTRTIILTQPLTESLVTRRHEDIKIWEVIITTIMKNESEVTIKRHPREKDSLHQARRDAIEKKTGAACLELDKDMPFESYLPHLKPGSCVAGYSSTALHNGAEIRPDIMFYEIKHEDKRNARLVQIVPTTPSCNERKK